MDEEMQVTIVFTVLYVVIWIISSCIFVHSIKKEKKSSNTIYFNNTCLSYGILFFVFNNKDISKIGCNLLLIYAFVYGIFYMLLSIIEEKFLNVR